MEDFVLHDHYFKDVFVVSRQSSKPDKKILFKSENVKKYKEKYKTDQEEKVKFVCQTSASMEYQN